MSLAVRLRIVTPLIPLASHHPLQATEQQTCKERQRLSLQSWWMMWADSHSVATMTLLRFLADETLMGAIWEYLMKLLFTRGSITVSVCRCQQFVHQALSVITQ